MHPRAIDSVITQGRTVQKGWSNRPNPPANHTMYSVHKRVGDINDVRASGGGGGRGSQTARFRPIWRFMATQATCGQCPTWLQRNKAVTGVISCPFIPSPSCTSAERARTHTDTHTHTHVNTQHR